LGRTGVKHFHTAIAKALTAYNRTIRNVSADKPGFAVAYGWPSRGTGTARSTRTSREAGYDFNNSTAFTFDVAAFTVFGQAGCAFYRTGNPRAVERRAGTVVQISGGTALRVRAAYAANPAGTGSNRGAVGKIPGEIRQNDRGRQTETALYLVLIRSDMQAPARSARHAVARGIAISAAGGGKLQAGGSTA